MENVFAVAMWAMAAWIAAKVVHSEMELPRGNPDCADKVAAVVFSAATIALPICAWVLFGKHAPAWLWPLLLVSSVGLGSIAYRAARGLPMVTAQIEHDDVGRH